MRSAALLSVMQRQQGRGGQSAGNGGERLGGEGEAGALSDYGALRQ